MDATSALSRGAVEVIVNDYDEAWKLFPNPVMQVLLIKQGNPTPQGTVRYRVSLSDGKHYFSALLAGSVHELIQEEKLVRMCVVRIKRFTQQFVSGRNITVIFELDVLEEYGTPDKLGNPELFQPKAAPAAAAEATISGNDFYGAPKKEEPKSQAQPLRSVPAAAPNGGNIYPIEGLSPYAHKWTIKARVTFKSDIKTWHKATNEGKLFSVNLLDESGEIRATGFNDQCDAFYELLQEGSVFYISNCKVGLAKKQFSNLPNDYELTFERETTIEKAEDQANVPQVRFNFTSILNLQEVQENSTVDIIGVLKEVGEVNEIVSKKQDGRVFEKRDVTLVDDTGHSVRVTVWGKTAKVFDAELESIIAFKGTKVSDYNGKSLSLLSSGSMSVDPDIPDAHRLKGWYDSAGRAGHFENLANKASMGKATNRNDQTKTIQQIKDENVGLDDQAYYSLKGTIVFVKQDNFCYPGCPTCRKKILEVGGVWNCEKCVKEMDRPDYKYMLSAKINDFTGAQWVTCFDETASAIIGKTANELMAIKEEDETQSMALLGQVLFTDYIFRCRAKASTYQDNVEVRHQVVSATPIDWKTEGNKLSELIKQYNIDG